MKQLLFHTLLILISISCSKEDSGDSPFIEFVSPEANTVLFNGVSYSVELHVSSKTASIVKVELYASGDFISSKLEPPYIFNWIPTNKLGEVNIVGIAYDSNNKSKSSNLVLKVELREGDPFKGGIIFQLDENGTTGLIASSNDVSINDSERFEYGYSDTFSGATSFDDGAYNTNIASPSNGPFSAINVAKNYNGEGYSDWYLPAFNELTILKEKMNLVGNFFTTESGLAMYWSSTESDGNNALGLNFAALSGNPLPKYYAGRVRPIRKF